MIRRRIIFLVFLGWAGCTNAFCTPLSDLASPDQGTRDAAAAILRQMYGTSPVPTKPIWRKAVAVKAPPGFTGTWTLYYENGQKAESDTKRNGYLIEVTAFYNNGTPYFTQHYDRRHIASGEIYRLGPTGRIISIEHCVTGKGVVSITWINEDGSTRETDALGKPIVAQK